MQFANPRIARIVRTRLDMGWTIVYGKRHRKLVAPTGHTVPIPATGYDRGNIEHVFTRQLRDADRKIAALKEAPCET